MNEIRCDVAVIGGGPAGLAASAAAKENGAEKVIILERDSALGGILQQCIHPGFGLVRFQQELTGPEYYGRFLQKALELGVESLLGTMVLEINAEDKTILCTSARYGLFIVRAGSIVLAMGCRERTRANIRVPGTRPAGLYTAGTAQRLLNRQNIMVGKKVVILGSGDIGMIMARRMTLEGAEVVMVVELMDYLSGLTRNRVQCLDDFGIPLKLSHTITRIVGERRVTGVYVAPVDENRQPIPEREFFVECDTVLFSVGLIPENELTRKTTVKLDPVTGGPAVNQYMQTSAPAVFACGNAVHVNDFADNVTAGGELAGKYAALYAAGKLVAAKKSVLCVPGTNVRYLCPQSVELSGTERRVKLFFRVLSPMTDVTLTARCGDTVLCHTKELRVNPGEMNYVTVDPLKLTGDTVTVDVCKED